MKCKSCESEMVVEDNQYYCPDCGAINEKVGKPKREFSDEIADKVIEKLERRKNEKRKTEKDEDGDDDRSPIDDLTDEFYS